MADMKHRPKTKDGAPMMKMKELAASTGVAKSTILLYVKQGLLPQPVKTSPNMAYYDPVCGERIAFIKKVQATHRLPLAAIKGLLKEMEKGNDAAPLLELQSTIFGNAGKNISKNTFCKTTGLTLAQVDDFCRLKILIPMEDGHFDARDQAIGALLKVGIDMGMQADELKFYPDLADQIVSNEIALRKQYTKSLSFEKDAALTLEMTQMARGLRAYIIDRTMQKRLIEFKGLKDSADHKKTSKEEQ